MCISSTDRLCPIQAKSDWRFAHHGGRSVRGTHWQALNNWILPLVTRLLLTVVRSAKRASKLHHLALVDCLAMLLRQFKALFPSVNMTLTEDTTSKTSHNVAMGTLEGQDLSVDLRQVPLLSQAKRTVEWIRSRRTIGPSEPFMHSHMYQTRDELAPERPGHAPTLS